MGGGEKTLRAKCGRGKSGVEKAGRGLKGGAGEEGQRGGAWADRYSRHELSQSAIKNRSAGWMDGREGWPRGGKGNLGG